MRFSVRREDRRNLAVGFIGLLAITTAHSVMETARDTLFLTSLPAEHLPRAYLAIAVLAIVELKIHEQVLRRVRDRRRLLSASLVFGALVTLGFWALLEELGSWAPFGFYIWTGLLITVVLIEFWLLLDDAVTVRQAKRIFPAIAAGGVTGATFGSLLSEGVLRLASPLALVFTAAAVLALAGATPFLWKSRSVAPTDQPSVEPRQSMRWLLRDKYLARILGFVLMGTITLTIVDFVFKSTVAAEIPPAGLGPFFARFYLGLNTVALLVQLVGAGWLLRAFGAHRSSALLPALVFGGALGLAIGPILPFAVALKAVDGSLRHTLYRGAIEVLYLPLDSRRRERAKGLIEVFGHRVGQALASLLIIAAVGVGLSTRQLAMSLLFLVLGWLMAIMSTRRQYVDQFRARLRHGVIDMRLEREAFSSSGGTAAKSDEWIGTGNSHTQSPRAGAIPHEGGAVFHEILTRLIVSDDDSVRFQTLRAMEGNPEPPYLPLLLSLLGSSELRARARKAILAIGPQALDALETALSDPSVPWKVRLRIPYTIILFEPQKAADILLRQLGREQERGLRMRILRALGRLQASHPSTVLDDALLQEQLRASLLRVVQLLQWRAAIEGSGSPDTPDAELLRIALQDKERATLEQAFSLMGLRHAEENFALVWRGVTSENNRLQAASHEVLEATLPGYFREAVLVIVDRGEPAERRARIAAAALGVTLRSMSHEEALSQMMQDQSEVVRGIATQHAAGLGDRTPSEMAQEVQNLV